VVSRCDLVIANDTMLLHMAGAQNVRALGIFGPTDPAQTRPLGASSDHLWLGPSRIPCAPCHRDGYYPPCLHDHRCMRSLSVESLLSRARALLGKAPRSASLGAAFG
jgi:heptosyltransferase II